MEFFSFSLITIGVFVFLVELSVNLTTLSFVLRIVKPEFCHVSFNRDVIELWSELGYILVKMKLFVYLIMTRI